MTDAHEDLARRLLAHEKWDWGTALGIANDEGARLIKYENHLTERTKVAWTTLTLGYDDGPEEVESHTFVLNLDDHGTQGILLGKLWDLVYDLEVEELGDGVSWVAKFGPHGPKKTYTGAGTRGEVIAEALLTAWDLPEGER